jgi:hypothetical protein
MEGANTAADPEAQEREDLRQRSRAALVATARNSTKKPDKTYEAEYKRYVKFCLANGFTGPPPLITRERIDCYFSEEVTMRRVAGQTARRVVSALQWFADNREYVDAERPFNVESDRVKKIAVAAF